MHFLDWFFTVFHTLIIFINLFGWIFRRTRILNRIVLSLTTLSWFVLGIWYGWGYCLCTDWHWVVLRKMGYTHLPSSYITFLIERFWGVRFDDNTVQVYTAVVYGICVMGCLFFWVRGFRQNKAIIK